MPLAVVTEREKAPGFSRSNGALDSGSGRKIVVSCRARLPMAPFPTGRWVPDYVCFVEQKSCPLRFAAALRQSGPLERQARLSSGDIT
jgi:hypothetical protein